jgi:hypothetical protein
MSDGRISVGFPFIANRFGGSTVSSLLLAAGLKELGHNIIVIAHGNGPLIQAAEDARLPVGLQTNDKGLHVGRCPYQRFGDASDLGSANRNLKSTIGRTLAQQLSQELVGRFRPAPLRFDHFHCSVWPTPIAELGARQDRRRI